MGYKLVIAEKPSVALSIAKVLEVRTRKNGYYEGNGYRVSWCVGHLVSMSNPNRYDEKYIRWRIEDLPIIPNEFQYEVSTGTKKQFLILKKLMNSKDTSLVINACDAGREGESIFRLVYEEAGCSKEVKRLWISSMEDSAIQEGFEHLEDGRDFENLFQSAQARSIADWLVGMNLSRLYSCLYQQNYSVGRVQTPTLAMIVERDDKILRFNKEKYYTVQLKTKDMVLTTDRIDEKMTAELVYYLIDKSIKVTNVVKTTVETKPDLPFDLTNLQRACNKYFGFSAKQTLDYAQRLYEKKLITYPRTDSRYLTVDMVTNTVNNILGVNAFDTERIKIIFNSKKVSDHHAIIPTVSSLKADLSKLTENEKKIYELICNQLHASVGFPMVEEKLTIESEIESFLFKTTGKTVVEEGFNKFLKHYTKAKKQSYINPDLSVGDVLEIEVKTIKENFTKPPQHYTEDTLLKAMEIAGNETLDKSVEVERKGLGTPATRACIIEHLIARGFVERDKKNLVATHKGVNLVTIVADTFKSAETTAKWEMELANIAQGRHSKEQFLSEIKNELIETISSYQNGC